MTVLKHAKSDQSVHELIAKRWSRYVFAEREVLEDDLRSLFDAPRWAASSYNEQPLRQHRGEQNKHRSVRSAGFLPG